jgi:hypothetical protein
MRVGDHLAQDEEAALEIIRLDAVALADEDLAVDRLGPRFRAPSTG